MSGIINITDATGPSGPQGPQGPQGPVSVASSGTVVSSTSTGVAGSMSYDTNYLYVCVATDTWIRLGNTGTNITIW
jgi:hypothetical protein